MITEFTIVPVYEIYNAELHTSLLRLHGLWENWSTKFGSEQTHVSTQAWQYIQALIFILRLRGEWDEEKCRPKAYFMEDQEDAYREVKCPTCKAALTWDKSAYLAWDGECSICGTILDPDRRKAATG